MAPQPAYLSDLQWWGATLEVQEPAAEEGGEEQLLYRLRYESESMHYLSHRVFHT